MLLGNGSASLNLDGRSSALYIGGLSGGGAGVLNVSGHLGGLFEDGPGGSNLCYSLRGS